MTPSSMILTVVYLLVGYAMVSLIDLAITAFCFCLLLGCDVIIVVTGPYNWNKYRKFWGKYE